MDKMTFKEIADHLGISKTRVLQVRDKALVYLRKIVEEIPEDDQ